MKQYTFNKIDSGIYGKAFEMAIKDALNRKHPDSVSPCGQTDFIYNRKRYDVKQNGTCIKYAEHQRYIKGSNRVIYATHIAYNVISETADTITITVDLANTDMFLFDRNDFINYLQEINGVKVNASRGTANIQTCYNYKKNAYHGKKGKMIEEWGFDNQLYDDDDIIGAILAGLE